MADRRTMDPADFDSMSEEDKSRMATMIDHLQVRDRCVIFPVHGNESLVQ